MARSFNLTAQLNLAGPNNIRPIINNIRQQLGSITATVNVRINPSAVNSVNSLNRRLTTLNASLVQINTTAAQLTTTLGQLGTAFQAFNAAGVAARNINASARALREVQRNATGATTQMEEFGRQSALAVRRFTAFSVATGAIFGIVGALKSGFSEAVKFDKEMVKLSQVTGLAVKNLSDISDEVTRLSIKFGTSSSELIVVASTLAQAGLSAKDTKVALEALAKSSLAPSFRDINETTEASIAILTQFGLKAKDLEGVLGSINSVSAAFAVEAEDITAAVRRAGGVFATAAKGISEPKQALNEFIAIFSSVRSTTRESAETIATGLRTIFTRIQRGSTIELLKKFGVQLTDLEGKFVGPYEAVNRLSEALNRIDPRDTQFSQIIEELGGFRQISKVIPLIQQVEARTAALGVAQKGTTSLTEDAATAQQSLANQFAVVREQFLAFVRSVGDTSTLKLMIGLTLKLASGLISIADAAKPLIPLLGVIGAVKGFSAFRQVAGGFFSGIGGGGGGPVRGGGPNNPNNPRNPNNAAAAATLVNTQAMNHNTYSIQQLTAALHNFNLARFNIPYPVGASSPVPRRFARGGLVPGSGSGDTVPAMLEPGEFVVRKNAVNAIGAGNLHQVNVAATGGQGIPKDFDKLSPAQQSKILRAQKFARQATDAEKEKTAKTFYLDGSQFAGIFHSDVAGGTEGIQASAIKRPASGVQLLNQQLKKLGAPVDEKGQVIKSGVTIKSHPGLYEVSAEPFKQSMGEVYNNIKKDISHIVASQVGGKLADSGIIENNLGQQKNAILGSIFEAAFKAVAGNGTGLFRGTKSEVFDFEPSGRDKDANFAALLGDGAGSRLKNTKYADAKFTGSKDNIASLFGKAIAAKIPVTKRANGGPIGGSGTGDSVPALLTPGEFVLRKGAAQALGSSALHELNHADKVQKFAGGGLVRNLRLRLQAQRAGVNFRGIGNPSLSNPGLGTALGAGFLTERAITSTLGEESAVGQGITTGIGSGASGAYLGGSLGGPVGAVAGGLAGALAGIRAFSTAVKENGIKAALDKLTGSVNKAEEAFQSFSDGRGTSGEVNTALQSFNQDARGLANSSATSVGTNGHNGFGHGLTELTSQFFNGRGNINALGAARNQDFGSSLLQFGGAAYGDGKDLSKIISDIDRGQDNNASKVAADAQGGAAVADQLFQRKIRTGGKLITTGDDGGSELTNQGKENIELIKALAFKGPQGKGTVLQLQRLAQKRDEDLVKAGNDKGKQKKANDDYTANVESVLVTRGKAVAEVSQDIADKERALAEAYKNSGKQLTAFTRIFTQLGAIAERNASELESQNAVLDARVASLTGTGTVGGGDASLSRTLANPDAYKTREFDNALDTLGNTFGADKNEALSNTIEFARGGKTLDDDLINIIKNSLISARKNSDNTFVGDENDTEDNNTVTQSIENGVRALNIPDALKDSVSSVLRAQLTNRQNKTLDEVVTETKNSDAFAPTSKIARESLQKLAESFDKANSLFTQSLNKLVGLRGSSLAAGDKVGQIQSSNRLEIAQILDRELTTKQLNAPIDDQLKRLGGNDPTALFTRFNDLQAASDDIETQKRQAYLSGDTGKFAELGIAAADTAVQINRTKQALELLTEGTKKAAVQTKLSEIANKREAGRGLLKTLSTAGPQQQFALLKDSLSFLEFRKNGNKLSGNPFQAQGVDSFIQLISPLLGKDKRNELNKQFAQASLQAGPLAGIFNKLPKDIQDSIQAAINNPGEAPEEQALIIELREIQTQQKTAAEALEKIANEAENIYGKAIVEQLQRFVDASIERLQLGPTRGDPNDLPNLPANNGNGPVQAAANGGWIRYASNGGSMFKPRGTDTVPAMLTPGEFVVNARDAAANRDLLENINTGYYANGGKVKTTQQLLLEAQRRRGQISQRDFEAKNLANGSGYDAETFASQISAREQGFANSSGRNVSALTAKYKDPFEERVKFATARLGQRTIDRLETFRPQDNPARPAVGRRNDGLDNLRRLAKEAREKRAQDIRDRVTARAISIRGGRGDGILANAPSSQDRVVTRAAARRQARRGRLNYATGGEVGGAGGGYAGAVPNFDNFVKAVQSLGTYTDKLAAIKIPESITLKAEIAPVQVVFSGENALAQAVIAQLIPQLTSLVQGGIRQHINPLTGATNEGTINPSQIYNRG